mgnify:CR=1 FL=1|jgi:hypothetical protein
MNEEPFKDHVKSSVPLDEDTQHQVSVEAVKAIVRDAKLATDRNWWALLSAALLAVVFFLLVDNKSLREELTYKYDVAWVKMYKNGTWDIEFNDSDRAREALPATIDAILAKWVESRFSEKKHSIRFDYGEANLFLSEELSSYFVSNQGFNAPQVAADVSTCAVCPDIQYRAGVIDHFDSGETTFNSQPGTLYRSTVFAERAVKWPTTVADKKDSTEERKIRIDWRLMSPEEIKLRVNQKGGEEWLRVNPIGLEIIDYDELYDPTNR